MRIEIHYKTKKRRKGELTVKKIIAIALALIVALSLTVSLSATALNSKGLIAFKLSGGSGSGSGSGSGGSGENSGEEPTTAAPSTEATTKAEDENTTKAEDENTTKSDEETKNGILERVKALLAGIKLPGNLSIDQIIDKLKAMDLSALIAGLGSGNFDLGKLKDFLKTLGIDLGSDSNEDTTAAPTNPTTTDPNRTPANPPLTNPFVPNVNTGDAE